MWYLLTLFLALFMTAQSHAATFNNVSYGGRLAQPDGEAIQGPVDLEISLHRTPTGDSQLHTKTFSNVKLDDGVFEVNLGDIRSFLGGDVWVEVKDATRGETYPRQKFTPVPFALRIPVKSSGGLAWDNGELKVNFPATAAAIGSKPVNISSTPADGQVLTYSGGNWVASTPSAGSAVNLSSPGPIGNSTASTGAFTALNATTFTSSGIDDNATSTALTISASSEVSIANLKITGGTPGTGKVLTSDTDGVATWQSPADWATPGAIGATTPNDGVFEDLTVDNNFTSRGIDDNATTNVLTITDTHQRVGIGIASPSVKLEVTGAIKAENGFVVGSETPRTVIFGYSINASNASCPINHSHGLDIGSVTVSGTTPECIVDVSSMGLSTTKKPVCTCSLASTPSNGFCKINTDINGNAFSIKTTAYTSEGASTTTGSPVVVDTLVPTGGWHQVLCIATKAAI